MTDGSGYMLYHSVGQYAEKAEDIASAMTAFAGVWSSIEGGHWPYALGIVARYVECWRKLIGAVEGTVTPMESVTSAASSIINALPERYLQGRTVLIAEDCFPSNHFLLTGVAEKLGFKLKTVPLRQGATWVEDEDMVSHWTPDVGLALITWVSSTSSHRCNLDLLVKHARRMGSLVGVDITQAVGLLPFDVQEPKVDFAISTSLKWLCGTPGAGILYVSPDLIPDCTPRLRGWFSQPDPFNWDISRFSYAPDIRRFDSGTPSVMACAATLPALSWHQSQDMTAMRAKNLELGEALQAGARSAGIRLASPTDAAQRGGSIMLHMDDSALVKKALEALEKVGVQADGRGRVLRLSPGYLTNHHGIERALSVLNRHRH